MSAIADEKKKQELINKEILAQRDKEAQYWKDVKEGKLPNPVYQNLAAQDIREKQTIAIENIKLQETVNRQKVLCDQLAEENIQLKAQLATYKVRLAEAKAPPKKSTKPK